MVICIVNFIFVFCYRLTFVRSFEFDNNLKSPHTWDICLEHYEKTFYNQART